jgi:adenine-specific DNA-methyltransferase
VANGLACVLNSALLDKHFRLFSGHTQVNATDLRNMRYPSRNALGELGKAYRCSLTQAEIDEMILQVHEQEI